MVDWWLDAGTAGIQESGAVSTGTAAVLQYESQPYRLVHPATRLVEQQVDLPPDARLHRAAVTVTAAPGSLTTPESVADVRTTHAEADDRTASIVDFGAIVTVGGLSLDGISDDDVLAVRAWTGSSWRLLGDTGLFSEVATERLLIEVADTTSGSDLVAAIAQGSLVLPAMPTFLELLVDGITVWFERQGSTAGLDVAPAPGTAEYQIDRTTEIGQALARSADNGGPRSVMVALRSATPGQLGLTIEPEVLRERAVLFPLDGAVHTVEIGEESELVVDVTPPVPTAEVREVSATVRGSFGPERVVPPIGPRLVDEATVVLAPERPVLLGIPVALASRLDRLSALRVHLSVPAGAGAEVAGRLLENTTTVGTDRPADPVMGGELCPCNVPAGASGWASVALAEPLAIGEISPDADVAIWLELVATYGEVEIGLTDAGVVPTGTAGTPPSELDAPGAAVLRRLPGGGTAPYTLIPSLGALQCALRVVGVPRPEQPLPAVTFAVVGAPASIGVSPNGNDTPVRLTLPDPYVPADPPPVTLRAIVASPGSLTLEKLRVVYYDRGGTGEAP